MPRSIILLFFAIVAQNDGLIDNEVNAGPTVPKNMEDMMTQGMDLYFLLKF